MGRPRRLAPFDEREFVTLSSSLKKYYKTNRPELLKDFDPKNLDYSLGRGQKEYRKMSEGLLSFFKFFFEGLNGAKGTERIAEKVVEISNTKELEALKRQVEVLEEMLSEQRQIEVERKPIEVEVIKYVNIPVETIKEVYVEIIKEVYVDKPIEIIKEVIVERPIEIIKEVIIERPIEIIKYVDRPLEVESEKMTKELEELSAEKEKTIEVIKGLESEIEKGKKELKKCKAYYDRKISMKIEDTIIYVDRPFQVEKEVIKEVMVEKGVIPDISAEAVSLKRLNTELLRRVKEEKDKQDTMKQKLARIVFERVDNGSIIYPLRVGKSRLNKQQIEELDSLIRREGVEIINNDYILKILNIFDYRKGMRTKLSNLGITSKDILNEILTILGMDLIHGEYVEYRLCEGKLEPVPS